jgi:prephenate dehydratase
VIERQQCCEIVQDGVKESEINETHVTAQGAREAEEDGNLNMNVIHQEQGNNDNGQGDLGVPVREENKKEQPRRSTRLVGQ